MPDFNKEDLLNKFLLGQLSEDERAAAEDRVVSDNDFFERLLVVEDEMIDAYIADELPAEERQLFEARFHTSSQNLERLEFAKTLRESLIGKQSESKPGVAVRSGWPTFVRYFHLNRPLAWAAAMVLAAVAVGAIWIFINRGRTDERNQQVRNQPTPSPEATRAEEIVNDSGKVVVTSTPSPVSSPPLLKNSKEPARLVTATFILTPGLSRDAGSARNLRIPPGATEIDLRLSLEQGTSTDFKKYRVLLSLADGARVWSGAAAPAADRALRVKLPARLFERGDYVLELKGVTTAGNTESVAEYSFRILQK